MFTPIKDELTLLQTTIQELVQLKSIERSSMEINNQDWILCSGHISGLAEAYSEIQGAVSAISEHIEYIVQNTMDGNFATKLGVLEDENRVLRDKNYLAEKQLKKLINIKASMKNGKKTAEDDKNEG